MTAALEPAVAVYANQIRPHLDRAAEEMFAVGDILVEAKSALPHGSYGALLVELDITPRTAQRFMAIAKNVVLTDATRVSHLPSAWGTLYELSRVPDEVLEAAIDAGQVTPITTRAEAEALRLAPAEPPLSAQERERFAALKYAIGAGLENLGETGGIVRLRLLDVLLRGVDDADQGDRLVREVLLSLAIDAMEKVPARDEGDTPVDRLSTAIGATLRHLWNGEHHEAVGTLAVVAAASAAVAHEVRPDVLLQLLDGRRVEEVHPTTALVVDAVLAGFAIEQQVLA